MLLVCILLPIDNTCLNCQGNFKYMEYLGKPNVLPLVKFHFIMFWYLDIPEFEIPTTSDSTLHSSQNTLQMSGSGMHCFTYC